MQLPTDREGNMGHFRSGAFDNTPADEAAAGEIGQEELMGMLSDPKPSGNLGKDAWRC